MQAFIRASVTFSWSPFVRCLIYNKPRIKLQQESIQREKKKNIWTRTTKTQLHFTPMWIKWDKWLLVVTFTVLTSCCAIIIKVKVVLFPYRSEDNLQQRVDKIDDDQGLLPLSMGVPLVGQLQVNLPEAVGQWRAVHPPVHDPTLKHVSFIHFDLRLFDCSACLCIFGSCKQRYLVLQEEFLISDVLYSQLYLILLLNCEL